MGLEVSWYLRFSRSDEIRALVDQGGMNQIASQVGTDMGWTMSTEPDNGDVWAVFRRSRG